MTELRSQSQSYAAKTPYSTQTDDNNQATTSFHKITPKDFTVQTVFSTIDLTSLKYQRPSEEIRKTKSQENANESHQSQDDIMEWIQEIYSTQKAKLWSDKLARLAQKLKKPGGEERMRNKIEKFLKSVPSNFSDGDEEGEEFRNRLPDYITKKLKKMFDINKNHIVTQYSVAVPEVSLDQKNKTNLRAIVKSWIKKVSIKRKHLIGRPISKVEILNSIVQRLEPFIIYRPKSTKDFCSMLKSYIMEIVCEIPLEHEPNDIQTYINSITDDLVERLILNGDIKTNYSNEHAKAMEFMGDLDKSYEQNKLNGLRSFVHDQLKKLCLNWNEVSKKRIIQEEIANVFSEVLQSNSNYCEMKTDIKNILLEAGVLQKNHAERITNELIANFQEVFIKKGVKTSKQAGHTFSETILVYDYEEETERKPSHGKIFSRNKSATNEASYTNRLSVEIEQWLTKYKNFLPIVHHQTFREMAVIELTETIVSRYKYLQIHPFHNEAMTDESEHLKLTIYKWIRKLAGEDKIEIIEGVPELVSKIREITVSTFKSEKNVTAGKLRTESYHIPNPNIVKELYDEIFDWYFDLPRDLHMRDRKIKKKCIKQLVDNIEKDFFCNKVLEEVIDAEVDNWAKSFLKSMSRNLLLEELKGRLINIGTRAKRGNKTDNCLQAEKSMSNKVSRTDFCIRLARCSEKDDLSYRRKIIKEIDEWLSDVPLSLYDKDSKNIAVSNLAADIIDRQKYLKLNQKLKGTEADELENLKYQIFKWLNKVISEDNLETVAHAPQLMQRLLTLNAETENSANHLINKCKSAKNANSNRYDVEVTKSTESFKKCNLKRKASSPSVFDFNTIACTSRGVGGTEICFSGKHGRLIHTLHHENLNKSKKIVERSTQEVIHSPVYSDVSYSSIRSRKTRIDRALRKHRDAKYRSDYSAYSLNVDHADFPQNYTYQSQNVFCSDDSLNNTLDYGSNPTNVYTLHGKKKKSSNRNKTRISSATKDHEFYNIPLRMNLQQTYKYFDNIFKKRCQEIPLTEHTQEQKSADEIARMHIHNGIWKIYFKLKSDSSVENDNALVNSIIENQLDILFAYLADPKDAKFWHHWKEKVIFDITKLLEYVHSSADTESFRQKLLEKFDRQFFQKYMDLPMRLHHILLTKTVNTYILYITYRDTNTGISSVYKHRLMKNLEELTNYIALSQKKILNEVTRNQLYQEAYKVLEGVTAPDRCAMKDLAKENLLYDEVDHWHNELPTLPPQNDLEELLRVRNKEALVKKLCDVEITHKTDYKKLYEEMIQVVMAYLQDCPLGQISCSTEYLADELVYRLMNRLHAGDELMKTKSLHEIFSGSILTPPITLLARAKPKTTQPVNCKKCMKKPTQSPPRKTIDHYEPEQLQQAVFVSQFPTVHPKPTQTSRYLAAPALNHNRIVYGNQDTSCKRPATCPRLRCNKSLNNDDSQGDVNSVNVGHLQTACPSSPEIPYNMQFSEHPNNCAENSSYDSYIEQYSPDNEYSDDNDEIRVRCQSIEEIYKCLERRNLNQGKRFLPSYDNPL